MTNEAQGAMQPWQVLGSSITYEDRWLRVRSDHCLTAEGVHIAPYHVIEYPDWVNVVALTRGDHRLVLVKQYRHGRGELLTELVSGTIEPAAAGPQLETAETAARRELQEETGYRGGCFERILTSYPNTANYSNQVTSFLALDVEPGGKPALDATEKVDVVLEDLPRVMRLLRSGEFRMQAMHVAALWSAVVSIIAGGEHFAAAAPLRSERLAVLG